MDSTSGHGCPSPLPLPRGPPSKCRRLNLQPRGPRSSWKHRAPRPEAAAPRRGRSLTLRGESEPPALWAGSLPAAGPRATSSLPSAALPLKWVTYEPSPWTVTMRSLGKRSVWAEVSALSIGAVVAVAPTPGAQAAPSATAPSCARPGGDSPVTGSLGRGTRGSGFRVSHLLSRVTPGCGLRCCPRPAPEPGRHGWPPSRWLLSSPPRLLSGSCRVRAALGLPGGAEGSVAGAAGR